MFDATAFIFEIILTILQVLTAINSIFALIIVFIERKNPGTTWAWVFLVMALPVLGFLLYLMIGMDNKKYRVFAQKVKEDAIIYEEFQRLPFDGLKHMQIQNSYLENSHIATSKEISHLKDLACLNYTKGNGAFTNNNEIEMFFDGEAKFNSLLSDISNAKLFVHIQYYIVRNDELGRRVINALAQKASEGVEVKMYIDGMGSAKTRKDRKLYEPLLNAGGKIVMSLPPHLVRINFRNHRKLCVIDGLIGYIGGFNIGDEYLGKVPKFGHWRDTHIRITGDAIKHLEVRFIMDWNFCVKSNSKGTVIETEENPGRGEKIEFSPKYFPVCEPVKGVDMQIVSSGPDTLWPNILHGYTKMAFEANKSIYIVTPYFVPNQSILDALKLAGLSGCDVRIVIPANPDHPFVYWSSLSYLGELLKAGVKCYEYQKGFVHSKIMMIDGSVTSLGTANMDIRSFDVNFEINAFIYDVETTKKFEKQFFSDLDDCTEITMKSYNERKASVRFKESFSRLISPLL